MLPDADVNEKRVLWQCGSRSTFLVVLWLLCSAGSCHAYDDINKLL